jgi:hypothetical protein
MKDESTQGMQQKTICVKVTYTFVLDQLEESSANGADV